jgi:hypothetical protein
MNETDRPIVVISVFKSGTWLIRKIIEDITHLKFTEPEPVDGFMDQGDPDHLFHRPSHFYSWHLVPTAPVQKKLRAMNARVVIVLRNVYDLAVSMYYHFADNIDWDIGRGANQSEFFKSVGKERGLAYIISGRNEKGFLWPGIGYHLKQMQLSLEFSQSYPCCVLTFERLVQNRRSAVVELSKYLKVEVDEERLSTIVESSSFKSMKERGERKGISSHFRNGKAFAYTNDLNKMHIALLQTEIQQFAPKLETLAHSSDVAEIIKCDDF